MSCLQRSSKAKKKRELVALCFCFVLWIRVCFLGALLPAPIRRPEHEAFYGMNKTHSMPITKSGPGGLYRLRLFFSVHSPKPLDAPIL